MTEFYNTLVQWYNEELTDGEALDALGELGVFPDTIRHIWSTDGDELTDEEAIELLESEYYAYVANQCDKLQWNRMTKQELTAKLQEITGNFNLELGDIDESCLATDYAFIAGIFNHCGYIHIYYIPTPMDPNTLLLTGFIVAQE